jgi:NAD(P)-dependent dehydrogenase (short-subunit alcohol dehydrogenase family)
MKNEELKGQTAIISGALGDIGRAIAFELAGSGANIALGDLADGSAASGVLSSLQKQGVKARYDRVDVTDAVAVNAWVENVATTLGTPSLIVPNAAIATLKHAGEISDEEWTREISINLNGAFYLANSAAKKLLAEQREGRIVFIGSWAADRPHPHIVAYSAAKAGLRMLMQCMALEFASHGILVNEIAPGYVNAGLSGKIFDADPHLKEQARLRVPIQKLIEPQEVAQQVAFLCSPKNRHMTGSVLTMDGGLSLQGTLTP